MLSDNSKWNYCSRLSLCSKLFPCNGSQCTSLELQRSLVNINYVDTSSDTIFFTDPICFRITPINDYMTNLFCQWFYWCIIKSIKALNSMVFFSRKLIYPESICLHYCLALCDVEKNSKRSVSNVEGDICNIRLVRKQNIVVYSICLSQSNF